MRSYRLTLALLVVWTTLPGAFAQSGSLGIAHLRLLTPLSSIRSQPGSEFKSVVIAPFESSSQVVMPAGTIVYGTVTSRKAVGLGFVHERAGLSVAFREYALPDGQRFALQARLRRIDDGRETVTSDGQIKGILAANNPQAIVGGVWAVPSWTLLERSMFGLTGLAGRIWEGYELGPFGAVGLFALRCALFRMPEPDIQLPVGTEFSLAVLQVPNDAPRFEIPETASVPDDLAEFLREQPFGVTRLNGRPVRDIVNLAFEGTREELLNSFRAAGWSLAAPLTPRSFREEYTAFATGRGYSAAPASVLLYLGQKPTFVFEKSLNSITMRHHVRVWSVHAGDRELWLAAATHDIGLGFDPRAVKFVHRIQTYIDSERNKIVNDLAFAGCSAPAGFVDRPNAAAEKFNGAAISTDGRLAVTSLIPCEAAAEISGMDRPKPVGSSVSRLARRVILQARQHVERDNAFFWTYQAIRWGQLARRSQTLEDNDY